MDTFLSFLRKKKRILTKEKLKKVSLIFKIMDFFALILLFCWNVREIIKINKLLRGLYKLVNKTTRWFFQINQLIILGQGKRENKNNIKITVINIIAATQFQFLFSLIRRKIHECHGKQAQIIINIEIKSNEEQGRVWCVFYMNELHFFVRENWNTGTSFETVFLMLQELFHRDKLTSVRFTRIRGWDFYLIRHEVDSSR